MKYLTTKNNCKNNSIQISFADFVFKYVDGPWLWENRQMYFDGIPVRVYEYDDETVTLESTFDCDFEELYS